VFALEQKLGWYRGVMSSSLLGWGLFLFLTTLPKRYKFVNIF